MNFQDFINNFKIENIDEAKETKLSKAVKIDNSQIKQIVKELEAKGKAYKNAGDKWIRMSQEVDRLLGGVKNITPQAVDNLAPQLAKIRDMNEDNHFDNEQLVGSKELSKVLDKIGVRKIR